MKRLVKTVLNGLSALLVLPLVLYARIGLRPFHSEMPYAGVTHLLALVPGYPGRFLRRAFYCLLLSACPWDIDIHFGSIVTHPTTRIGAKVWVGLYTLIGTAEIGDDVLISSRVSILSGRHHHGFSDSGRPISTQEGRFTSVKIGSGSWLGEGAIVMADVGQGSVIGAGAVVVKPVPDHVIAAGNPAREIRRRIPSTQAGRETSDRLPSK